MHIFYYRPLKYYVQICRKIAKIVATRCQILRLKRTKFDFGWGAALDRQRLTALPQTPYSWVYWPFWSHFTHKVKTTANSARTFYSARNLSF